jgi:hypothetical protein
MAVWDQVSAELEALDAVGSVEGQCALALASQLDGRHNTLSTATDVKQLMTVMATIRDLKPAEADSVDDSRDETDRILRAVR